MEFRELTNILTIAEEGSLSKAAEKLFVSQSSLSQFLKSYEAAIGCSLFVRTSTAVSYTHLVYMMGTPAAGVGPQDVALDIIRNVFSDGFVKNRIMEFAGPGIAGLSMDFRNGIDVMTTEASCVSTIWQTDSTVKDWLSVHKRENEYREIRPSRLAYYDYLLEVDLGEVKPMIALPFHPSNAYTIEEVNENPEDILRLTEENCNARCV